MAKPLINKRLQVDKETRSMVIAAAVAAFVIMFCIFSAHSLITVMSYQNRVINKESQAANQLTSDISASNRLDAAYTKFNNTSGNNLLGASSTGTGPNQGDNAKLVLDALPSVDDYPSLLVDLQNLFASNKSVSLMSLSVTNTESSSSSSAASSPGSVESATAIPITFSISGPSSNIDSFIQYLYKSILPIQILNFTLSGSQNALTFDATAQTYYQPAVSFMITTETVH